jgi:hypothetical protein
MTTEDEEIRKRAEKNRADFPFTAQIMEELRAPHPKHPEWPPLNPRVISATENGKRIGAASRRGD